MAAGSDASDASSADGAGGMRRGWSSTAGRQDDAIDAVKQAFYMTDDSLSHVTTGDEASSDDGITRGPKQRAASGERRVVGSGSGAKASAKTPLLSFRKSRPQRRRGIKREISRVLQPEDTHVDAHGLPHVGKPLESLDYDMFESRLQQDWARSETDSDVRSRTIQRWALTFVVGVVTALIAVLITYVSRELSLLKFKITNNLIAQERAGSMFSGAAFIVYVGTCAVLGFVSSFVIAKFAPVGAGSGISEIKTVLNGMKIPGSVRIQTLVAKVVGVMFSVSAGLPVGKEGPMIHSGAIAAAGLSQGKSTTMGVDTSFSKFKYFRNDKEKRDFITCGAAAGVAAAFGAPVGGVLFALEEGASFWFQELTWRAFFCALVSTYVLNTFLSGIDSHWGDLSEPGLFTFGDFTGDGQADVQWNVWELPVFMLMGAVGGVLGAAFNGFNTRITKWRMRVLAKRSYIWRVWETVLVATVVATLSYVVSLGFGECRPRPKHDDQLYASYLVQFYCPAGQYNEVASYFFTPSEIAIKQLFHFSENDAFSLGALLPFFLLYSLLTMWTYGLHVASGLFIPSLLAGSAFGRFVGQVLNSSLGNHAVVNAGTYALVGAAASLGGMARMTISLAVILLESTGNYQYGLPLMVTLLMARWVGNLFNEGLYDIHVELKRWPLLEWDPDQRAQYLHVAHVMTPKPKSISKFESAGKLYDLLYSTTHNGFPVVSFLGTAVAQDAERDTGDIGQNGSANGGAGVAKTGTEPSALANTEAGSASFSPPSVAAPALEMATPSRFRRSGGSGAWEHYATFAGIILRKHLCVILNTVQRDGDLSSLRYQDFESRYPRYPKIESIRLTESQRSIRIDLSSFINRTPYVIQARAPVMRAFVLFRGLGLRHLCVVDELNRLVGIVTRKNLTHGHLHKSFDRLFVPETYASGWDVSDRSFSRTAAEDAPLPFVRSLDAEMEEGGAGAEANK